MKKELRDPREGFERWIDDRIRAALASLTVPLESRIKNLRKRVEKMQSRLQGLTALIESSLEPKKPPPDREKTVKS